MVDSDLLQQQAVHFHWRLAAQQFHQQQCPAFAGVGLEDALGAGERAVEDFHAIALPDRHGIKLHQPGLAVHAPVNHLDDGLRHGDQLHTKANQRADAARGPDRAQALLISYGIQKQIAGKQWLNSGLFAPGQPLIGVDGHRQETVEFLPNEIFLGYPLLPRFGINGVPTGLHGFHNA